MFQFFGTSFKAYFSLFESNVNAITTQITDLQKTPYKYGVFCKHM